MPWFKKIPDPISDRSRILKAEIAALENKIKQLNTKIQHDQTQPKLRSTALPPGSISHSPQPHAARTDPIFESVQLRSQNHLEPAGTPAHYNDLGVRKYDLPALWRRIQNHFRGPPASNPKLINYLAAGTIKGLRPLRYEKRVARNRFIGAFLLLLLLGFAILYMVFHR